MIKIRIKTQLSINLIEKLMSGKMLVNKQLSNSKRRVIGNSIIKDINIDAENETSAKQLLNSFSVNRLSVLTLVQIC